MDTAGEDIVWRGEDGTDPTEVEVGVIGDVFVPPNVTVNSGDIVRFFNIGAEVHDAVAVVPPGSLPGTLPAWSTGPILPGNSQTVGPMHTGATYSFEDSFSTATGTLTVLPPDLDRFVPVRFEVTYCGSAGAISCQTYSGMIDSSGQLHPIGTWPQPVACTQQSSWPPPVSPGATIPPLGSMVVLALLPLV
jgi:plastocyanin